MFSQKITQNNKLKHQYDVFRKKQASDAGVSRQCLEQDKMSKGARNVDIGDFYTTQPPERVQIWVTWARVTNEIVRQSTIHISYENKK